MRNFRKLNIWNDAIDYAVEIYQLAELLPKNEEFGLKSQMKSASVSINIAEGCSISSDREYGRFLETAEGSAFEVETQLIVSMRLKYIDSTTVEASLTRLHSLQRRINTLIQRLKQTMTTVARANRQ